MALRRFYSLERKLQLNLDLKTQYMKFLREYLELGHMTEHEFVLTADIEKMFRQVVVHPDNRNYQKILWRDSMSESIKTYILNTVTYGTAPAPFLSTRSLNQLTKDEAKKFPVAAEVFMRDFYIDDLLTRTDSLQAALELKEQCIALARAGGFHVRQWTSNDTRLIADLQIQNQQESLCLDPSETKKTLGVYSKPASDQITYIFKQLSSEQPRITKRVLLSEIAQLFDPLSLLGPVIIKAKIIMQQLWKTATDWDELVPQTIKQSRQSCGFCLARTTAFSAHTKYNMEVWSTLVRRLQEIEILEKRRPVTLFTHPNVDLLTKYSSIDYLNRIVAYIFRFYNNLKRNSRKGTGPLSISEIQNANFRIVRLVQLEAFPYEVNNLENGKGVNRKSKLINFNPFIDNNGKQALLRYDQKYPIILPHKHHVTELIIRQIHLKQLRSGTQTTLYMVRKKYWPIAGKSIVKQLLHKCIQCCKYNPRTPQYIMGNLAKKRIIQTRQFESVGIDYCEAFLIKKKKFRNKTKVKCYVAVFVCFATKAIHSELATDLTTESCLRALKQFIARRRKPRHIYSDNGTNFVGAKNEIVQIREFLLSNEYKDKFPQFFTQENVEWHFSPPRSPHFGGLWEAASSFKKHLHKSVGQTMFTYEQFYTLIVEIEGILNSRPLTPI
ncbi:uncharacterized protein LOC143357353 [Halictus rubicundus]|uniref:uncharacterized protein LOC143357353 n=1 Tax=Halictus rubicundus TaxID=77578 RepID=UPI004036749C